MSGPGKQAAPRATEKQQIVAVPSAIPLIRKATDGIVPREGHAAARLRKFRETARLTHV